MRANAFIALTLVALMSSTSLSGQGPGALPSGEALSGEILVKFRPGSSADQRADAHRQAGGTRLAGIARTRVERVRVPVGSESASIARYERNPNVLYAERHLTRRIPTPLSHAGTAPVPGDFYFNEQYALHNSGQLFVCIIPDFCLYVGTPDADIDAPEAWAMSTGSPDVVVSVIDSGIDHTHPDLAGNFVGGFDFYTNDSDPMDDHGHGTHVAGTIAAAMNNLTGDPAREEGVVGVAPDVRLLAYKVCGVDGSCSDFAIQQAIAASIAAGAKVINMSLGQTGWSDTLNDAVQDAWNAGLVIVAGAGNNGLDQLFYPAAFDNVISVGAFDEDHRRASFSNFGMWVDLSAPGNVILSTYPLAACGGSTTVPGDTGCYNWLSGTSMATPHVSGAAALVWSRPDVASNSQVADILLGSADGAGVDTNGVRLDSWTIRGGLNIHDALSFGIANQPPVANAGPDQTLADQDRNGAEDVALDGSGSSDPDGLVDAYEWREGDAVVATGATPTVTLAVGTHVLTLGVTDNDGATATDTLVVTIQAAAPADTVTITKATYNSRRSQLTVEATSSGAPAVTLTVHDTTNPAAMMELGPMQYNAKRGVYTATFTRPSKPASIAVISSGGGTATSSVGGK
jgi:thermitase